MCLQLSSLRFETTEGQTDVTSSKRAFFSTVSVEIEIVAHKNYTPNRMMAETTQMMRMTITQKPCGSDDELLDTTNVPLQVQRVMESPLLQAQLCKKRDQQPQQQQQAYNVLRTAGWQ